MTPPTPIHAHATRILERALAATPAGPRLNERFDAAVMAQHDPRAPSAMAAARAALDIAGYCNPIGGHDALATVVRHAIAWLRAT